jgi:putative membrane-bound dehydrogenase-like protein
MSIRRFGPALALGFLLVTGRQVDPATAAEEREVIPHAQDKPPGPPLTPAEAVARMTVPEGFRVELVASEPDIVNPVAMTFDERGRAWITESLEYPRREAGTGRDRVKVLEDTDGDGGADRFTVFADGLNIPSGIAVGHGGVWVANAPDLLYLQDTDGDGRADRQEVVVTGFGRADTHELPNSLTWGPDGWLYGINGVFNPSHIEYRGKTFDFTCALFRVHPKSRDFEVFAEGTSNPWGVAFDTEGSAFFSACVIDHLWHIVESGYYHRQGGPYPPFTWKIGSIVKHKHQKAAYCGIHFFDSDAYPPEYRGRLYMGNIHGGCINVDCLARDGATYFATPAPDFLTANDAWFMPVVQKTGPDGCLYILDWYDRYHCYQDANRDPQGIDRLKGRLYRVRYQDAPRRYGFDLAACDENELIDLLASPNVYDRDVAQRLLAERAGDATARKLEQVVLDDGRNRSARMHALWALIGRGDLTAAFMTRLLGHDDSILRAWGVRAAGNSESLTPDVLATVARLAADPSPDVRLQVAIVAGKCGSPLAPEMLLDVISHSDSDPLIPHIVWRNLQPLLEDEATCRSLIAWIGESNFPRTAELLPFLIERVLARRTDNMDRLTQLYTLLVDSGKFDSAPGERLLATLTAQVQSGELADRRLELVRAALDPLVRAHWSEGRPLWLQNVVLAASWGDRQAVAEIWRFVADGNRPGDERLAALEALIAAGDDAVLEAAREVLANRDSGPVAWRADVLAALGRMEDPRVAEVVLFAYTVMEPELRPKAVELLTQRVEWARALLAAIGAQKLPAEALHTNQVLKLLAADDAEVASQVRQVWGTIRTERDPLRERMVARMRRFVREHPGDPHRGIAVYKKVCGQCHKMHGEGAEVGPDITVNGRASFEQLLSNVFDPSLVIGASYQARTVVTTDGRVLTGLLVEDNPQRVVLKVQGGKLETVPRDDVDEFSVSRLSMMPEDLEKQLKPEELADLFAYLTLDKPPGHPEASQLAGAAGIVPRETTDPALFADLIGEVAAGFHVEASGERGVGLLAEHLGRPTVVRTHPVDRRMPCVLRSTVTVPADRASRLVVEVAHDPRGDWRLVARADGQVLHDSIVGPKTAQDGWVEVEVDLTPLAGKTVELALENHANDWAWEFAYWRRVDVVAD